MIDVNIVLGFCDVSVGVNKLSYKDDLGESSYGLCFRDLISPEEIGAKLKNVPTVNNISIIVKNK